MLRQSCSPASPGGGAPGAHLPIPSAFPSAFSTRAVATAVRTFWDALREGLSAYRRYEQLRSHRIPHDTALRTALSCRDGDDSARAARRLSCLLGDAPSDASVVSGVKVPSLSSAARIGNLAFVP
jgi:hypothetical protein